MKKVRLLLISAVAIVALLLVGLAVVLNSGFQTWAVRKALAGRPDLRMTVGRVTAGFEHVELRNVQFDRNGMRFTAPQLTADVGLIAAGLKRHFKVSNLVAEGWTLRLSEKTAANSAGAKPADVDAFNGLISPLALPFDLEVGRLTTSGTVVLPSDRGTVQVKVSGGGLAPRKPGLLKVALEAALKESVHTVQVNGTLEVGMDTGRTFESFAGEFDASAAGPALNGPVVTHLGFAAEKKSGAENYRVQLTQEKRQLLELRAQYPGSGKQLTGSWAIDVRDADVAPFAFGRALPVFAAAGKGRLESDTALQRVHALGAIDASVDKLAVLDASLAAIGGVRMNAELDVAQNGSRLAVDKLDVAVSAVAQPGAPAKRVGTVRALQHFEFSPATGELQAVDASRELIGVVMEGVPLAWLRPFVRDVSFEGGDLRGDLVATPRAGGFSFRTKAPLVVTQLSVGRGGQPLVRDLDISLGTSGDYTPGGWQAEISGFSAGKGTKSMLLLDAKVGRLTGKEQPVKATGLLSVDLGALAAQPVASGKSSIVRGDATVEFAATVNGKTEIQANVRLKNLAADPAVSKDVLPAISAELRSDVGGDGKITFSAPIVLEREGRTSDVSVTGSFQPGKAGGAFEAQVTSTRFVIDDAKVLAALAPKKAASSTKLGPPAQEKAPWSGFTGTFGVQLKKVVYSDTFEMSNVTGTLQLADGEVRFNQLQGGVGEVGNATATGSVRFEAGAKLPYGLTADLTLLEFDATPIFAAVNPRQPPAIEGRFSMTTKVGARAATIRDLPLHAVGNFELTSRGGTFRGLPVNVGNLVENSSKLASWLASAGSAITSLAGRKDYDEITSRSQAANELAKILSSISYDQLAIAVTRDDELNGDVKDFALISPELRISGRGRFHRVPGRSLLNDVVELELNVRARGRPAELMKYLGVLDPAPDNLGYAACTIPVHIEGSLGRLDTTELSNRLVALAVAKTGLTEKAVDWINRLRGKSTN